jgi:hypothetical protein
LSHPLQVRRKELPKHCTYAIDRHCKRRVRFFRRGFSTYLKGIPWSEDFMSECARALEDIGIPSVSFPASSFLGGVRFKHKSQHWNEIKPPLIGVYLLMRKGQVVYIGSSLNMPNRVRDHKTNGRPFDQVFYIATHAIQREALERTLIRAINPPQKSQHRTAEPAAAPP